MAAKRIHPIIREHYRKMGRKGGRARANALTPERRSEIAKLGSLARQKNALDRQAREEQDAGHDPER